MIHLYNSTNAPIYVYHQFVNGNDSITVQGIYRIDTIKPYRRPLLASRLNRLLLSEKFHLLVYDEDTYNQFGIEGIRENNISPKLYYVMPGTKFNTYAYIIEYNGETIK